VKKRKTLPQHNPPHPRPAARALLRRDGGFCPCSLPMQRDAMGGSKIACCFPDHLESGDGGDGGHRGRPRPALVALNWLGVRDWLAADGMLAAMFW